MSTISVSELRKKPVRQWLQATTKDEVIVTAAGQPVAVLVRADAKSLEPTLSTLRSVRALQAQAALQEAAASNGTDKLSGAEIDAEVAAARRNRRRR